MVLSDDLNDDISRFQIIRRNKDFVFFDRKF